MKQWRYIVTLVILLAMVGLAGFTVVRVNHSTGIEQLPTSTEGIDSPDGPLTLEQAYSAAVPTARGGLTSPVLAFASLQADWPLDDQAPGPPQFPPGGWARFAFIDAAGARERLLSVVVERYSGAVVNAERQPWNAGENAGLPLGTTAITSDMALLIAEQAYGQAFRLQCPVDRHESNITLVDSRHPPAELVAANAAATPVMDQGVATPPVEAMTPGLSGATPVATPPADGDAVHWLVTYRDGRQPGVNSVEVEIDTTTGRVLVVRDQSLPCDSPT